MANNIKKSKGIVDKSRVDAAVATEASQVPVKPSLNLGGDSQ